ncbi:MAG: hypothetical protein M1831_003783 [Alyxoria varia]|nr:MAG: hypothetical protein M1831_003783 [Alyxoria varia]
MGSPVISIRELDFGESFAISAGTVTFDPSKGKVLLLRRISKGEYLLPKGRKSFGETIQAAAVRETKEETGFEVVLRPHDSSTQATTPRGAIAPVWHEEPFAVQQRLTPLTGRKIIFWYLATGSSSLKELGYLKEEAEDFETNWVDYSSALNLMTFYDDRRIVERALKILRADV